MEKLVQKNNIKPNNIIEPKETKRQKPAADMEKITSTIGIKHVNWSEVRNHASGHEKNKGDARRETLAKANAFGYANV